MCHVEPQESQAAQSWPRAASATQASAPAVQPLKPGFWKAMKLPAKDSPLGGIKVRADMVSDAFQACLHCLHKKHRCAQRCCRAYILKWMPDRIHECRG